MEQPVDWAAQVSLQWMGQVRTTGNFIRGTTAEYHGTLREAVRCWGALDPVQKATAWIEQNDRVVAEAERIEWLEGRLRLTDEGGPLDGEAAGRPERGRRHFAPAIIISSARWALQCQGAMATGGFFGQQTAAAALENLPERPLGQAPAV